MPGPRGIWGDGRWASEEASRSLLTWSPPQGQRLCAARPGRGWGEPAESSGSGAQCPAVPVLEAPLTPTWASSLWGSRRPGNPHLHMCPHLGLGLTPPPSHPPPTTGPPNSPLAGISLLPQPHGHPNLCSWASDLQRPPPGPRAELPAPASPRTRRPLRQRHTPRGPRTRAGPLILPARLPPPRPPPSPPRGPTDRPSHWGR